MGSSRYVGYVGGVAVAVGVGAAIAAAGQGTAAADSGRSDSTANTSQADTGPKKAATGTTAHTRPRSTLGSTSADATNDVGTVPAAASVATSKASTVQAARVNRLTTLSTGSSARSAAAAAAATTDSSTPTASDTVSVPWSPNPLRPMPPEPAPNDMPGPIWDLEQAVVNIFPDFFKPVPREIFEGGYRLTQMIPWVNIVVPFSNIGANLQAALSGDKSATQRIINNLIVTIEPVAILYYGYNAIADLVNLEQQALDLQTWAITTAWDILDPFQLLHNRGESGLPLSTSTPPAYPTSAASALV